MSATIGGMPNKPKTPHMSFRVEPELREAAKVIAERRGESLSGDVLRPALVAYVKKYGNEGNKA